MITTNYSRRNMSQAYAVISILSSWQIFVLASCLQ